MNVIQQAEAGTPAVGISKWPKDAIVLCEVVKNDEGRFVCRVKINDGEFFNLPGTHPTESDAQKTLKCYIEENSA